MKNLLTTLCLSISLWACQSKSSNAPLPGKHAAALLVSHLSPADSLRLHDSVDAIVHRHLLRGSFNGAILVAKDGGIVYEQYLGLIDPRLKAGDSITAETPFQIASTGKTMTSAAVLKLWEEGKLDINAAITQWFPGFPYPGVTVKTLLNHRSGLPNYLYYMEKGKWQRTLQATNEDILKTLNEWKPAKAANADKRFQYCNTNYVLLALLVEKVSGQSFPDYMRTTFFEPLGMKNSFVIGPNEQTRHMVSYQYNNTVWALDFSDGPYGDKNIYSTPRDLLLWDRALSSGLVLTKPTLDSAYAPYSNEKPGIRNYGLGWRMLNYPNGKKVIFHNGHWHGFNVAFSRLPDEDATIIIISNRYSQAVYTTAKRLYDIFGDYNSKHDEGEE